MTNNNNRTKGNYRQPETLRATHRPEGPPQAREHKSQKSQLASMPHGESKDVKRKMAYKTGLRYLEEKAKHTAGNTSGEDLTTRAQAVLDADKDLRGYGLKAESTGRRVFLTGIVDTLTEKERAAQLVAGITGNGQVDNGLTISTDGSITDAEVTEEVMEELRADPQVDLSHVGAESHGGKVVLMGSVVDPVEKEAAYRAAAKARGVRQVIGQIKIQDAKDLSLEDIFHSQVRNDEE